MELRFDHFFQFTDVSDGGRSLQIAVNLLKDYIVSGSSSTMGRSSGKWFWNINFPVQSILPSKVSVLANVSNSTDNPGIVASSPGWALTSRSRRIGFENEQFGRPLHELLDFPIESLFALIPKDFIVKIGLFSKGEPITGLRDAATHVCLWSDNETAIGRLAQWLHAKPVPYDRRNANAYFCEIGLSELPLLIRVPVYSDTFLPHLKSVSSNVVNYLKDNPDSLTRGMLIGGLPGSGKSTSLKAILSNVVHYPKLKSIFIADVKGEYQSWSNENRIVYLSPGQNPACLHQLNLNIFIPPPDLRLSAHIDSLAILLSIGNFGGSGVLLPGYIKIFLEEYYCSLLLHRIELSDWPTDFHSQRLLLLNCTGNQLKIRLQGNLRVFSYANRDLSTFWEDNSDSVIRRIFGRNGGNSNSRHEITDVIASRIGGFETSILQFMDYSSTGTSIDRLLTERICLGLNGLSKGNLQLLIATFTLLALESILAGPELKFLSSLFVFEEAHLVAARSTASDEIMTIDALVGQTVERSLQESRSKGCGIILTDQMPATKLISSVLANTNIKICHNLLGADAELMAKAMGLSADTDFSLLGVGEAIVKLGDDQPPVRSRIRL